MNMFSVCIHGISDAHQHGNGFCPGPRVRPFTAAMRAKRQRRRDSRFFQSQADACRHTSILEYKRHLYSQSFAAGYTLESKRRLMREFLRARHCNF